VDQPLLQGVGGCLVAARGVQLGQKLRVCVLVVLRLIDSSVAISLSIAPAATSLSTSFSRAVSTSVFSS